MLNNKVTVVSLVIIVFAIVVFLVSGGEKEKQSSQFCSFIDPANIKQITVEKGNETLSLISLENRWFITDNSSLRISADGSKVLPIFEFINDSVILQRITKKKAAYSNFDLEGSKASILNLLSEGAVKHVFYIGKQKDYSSQFVRKADDPYVYLVSKRLDINMDQSKWFYRKVMDYDFSELDNITYTCDKKQTLRIDYDKGKDKFFIKDVPAGKQAKGLKEIRDAFSNVAVLNYLPRTDKIETTGVVKHRLFFKGGGSITLNFLESKEAKATKHYLDINVDIKDDNNKDLIYIKSVSDKYLFSLSRVDKNKYQRKFDDFFEDKPEEKEDEGEAAN